VRCTEKCIYGFSRVPELELADLLSDILLYFTSEKNVEMVC
jgi:hypothetical protein